MDWTACERGLASLREAVCDAWAGLVDPFAPLTMSPAPAGGADAGHRTRSDARWLLSQILDERPDVLASAAADRVRRSNGFGDADLAASSADDEAEGDRLIALVELARTGDKEAFGQLYDHYHVSVFRFLYYRVSSTTLAEDLTAETFFRALRSMSSFRWQGKDFGAWLMTIARNLAADHFKAGRTRLEQTTEDMQTLDTTTDGPEGEVLTALSNEALVAALGDLPGEQRDCLVMRFLEGLSIAETAEVLGRSSGAVKQLQLRGVRNLAKLLPAEAFA
ncbi:sigma-70 family RNA polymerase sigma factor [Nocardioides terrisoli]|uniref:sigma-70 family RNA polymerase sigma factor n=1 Tax=Nocardioides terrisoli TaxID=3388267 RepID=UPI00287B9C5C|nr:sigma-70 family RNA polymerase sigma factor [Nocardioides marmorisolisilvae]